MDILEKLEDLHKQATVERSHHYVAAVATEAIKEIERLRRVMQEKNEALQEAWRKIGRLSGPPQ